jgi:hypothetical protein
MGDHSCEEVIDFFSAMRWFCIATETVQEELSDLALNSPKLEVRRLASDTLSHLNTYNILCPDLPNLNRDVAKIFAQRLSETDLIKGGTQNDALALTEAASHRCYFFITDREHLTQCNADAVRVALTSFDLNACAIVSLDIMLAVIQQLAPLVQSKNKPKT